MYISVVKKRFYIPLKQTLHREANQTCCIDTIENLQKFNFFINFFKFYGELLFTI